VAATISMVLFLLCGVILSLLVLIQRGRGGGLAGAFGGAGGSSAFGTKTADIFVKATAVLGGLFFVLAIITALLTNTSEPGSAPLPSAPVKGEAAPGGETGTPPAEAVPAPAPASGGDTAPATQK
jgi:preprotein translocase subunit SecG